MALLAPNSGEVLLLKYMLNHTAATNVACHLYTGNVTPSESDTLATYSGSESADSSYDPVTLTGSSWTIGTSSGVTTAVYAEQTFSFSTSATLYGYYITDNTNANLLWAERFNPGPFVISSSGGEVLVTPKIALD